MKQIKIIRILPIVLLLLLGLGRSTSDALGQIGNMYYVANEGSDSNDGLTPETAWQTLEHVSDQTFQPGDWVLFRRGDTWRETLHITSSGTPTDWITFGAYGTGDKPRMALVIVWVTGPNAG